MGIFEDIDSKNIHKAQIKYSRKETLCKEGGFSSSIKLILSGFVKVFIEGPENKNLIVKILKAGDFLGGSAICGDGTYYYSAIALKDTLTCHIDKDSVLSLIATNEKFALELTKWYCYNDNILFRKLASFGFKNIHGRIAETLLYLNGEDFTKENLYDSLTRKDIADMAGMPVESAVRLLSELSASKIIRMEGKRIEILDYIMLKRIRQGG